MDDELENNDVILSREEYVLLHAFHKLIPVPAITSGITRIICQEELQVGEEHIDVPEVDDSPEITSAAHVSIVRRLSKSAERYEKQVAPKPPKLVRKEYDLTRFTPRQPSRS